LLFKAKKAKKSKKAKKAKKHKAKKQKHLLFLLLKQISPTVHTFLLFFFGCGRKYVNVHTTTDSVQALLYEEVGFSIGININVIYLL